MVIPRNQSFIAVNEPQYCRGSEPAEQSISRSPGRETLSAIHKERVAQFPFGSCVDIELIASHL
jgi:hypothetical protein